jgi:hypothetical protein
MQYVEKDSGFAKVARRQAQSVSSKKCGYLAGHPKSTLTLMEE